MERGIVQAIRAVNEKCKDDPRLDRAFAIFLLRHVHGYTVEELISYYEDTEYPLSASTIKRDTNRVKNLLDKELYG